MRSLGANPWGFFFRSQLRKTKSSPRVGVAIGELYAPNESFVNQWGNPYANSECRGVRPTVPHLHSLVRTGYQRPRDRRAGKRRRISRAVPADRLQPVSPPLVLRARFGAYVEWPDGSSGVCTDKDCGDA